MRQLLSVAITFVLIMFFVITPAITAGFMIFSVTVFLLYQLIYGFLEDLF